MLEEKDFFLQNHEKIRDMNEITFGFLNLVFYSFLFYSNIQGFIKDKNLNKYLIKSMTCFEIMEQNWEKIYEILEYISVEIFINLIFEEIIQLFINNKIKDKNLIEDLKRKNDDLIKINPNSFKSIFQEIFPYNIYSKKDFPDFK